MTVIYNEHRYCFYLKGVTYPSKGQIVQVHYTGTLNSLKKY